MRMLPYRGVASVSGLLTILSVVLAALTASAADDWSPRRMLVGPYGLPDEEFLAFAERVRPEMVVMGTFGAPQWAAQENPQNWLAEWRRVCARLRRSGIKVVGMIELLNVADSPEQFERFRAFYEDRWPAELLGERPTRTAAELLEHREGPLAEQTGHRAPRGCATNPHWRTFLKALLKPLVDTGLDGFITHRNMYGTCGCPFCHAALIEPIDDKPHPRELARIDPTCPHCRRGFRAWLTARYDADALKSRFGIADLATHRFAMVSGAHRDHDRLPSPLELEMLTFSKHLVKDAFDDVFVRHGRKLKPDLIAAQWNHMPYFDELHLDRGHIPPAERTTFAHAAADERFGLPIDVWGRGESFFWYCNWGTTQQTQLDRQFAGDATLYAKLLRSLARGRPYVINKYDFYRPRNMLAEAAALGMLAGAIEVPHRTEEDRVVMERWFRFLERHAALFASNNGESLAEALLVYPRTATHAGNADGLERVEIAGRTMIVEHVPFDLISDDLLADASLDRYRALVVVEPGALDERQLAAFRQRGGRVIGLADRDSNDAAAWGSLKATVVRGIPAHSGGKPAAAPFRDALVTALGPQRTTIDAPWTVESHIYRQPGRLIVHLVNYDRDEKAAGMSSVARESPRAAPAATIHLPLGPNERIVSARFLDPDHEAVRPLDVEQGRGVVKVQTPGFAVYGLVVLELGASNRSNP